MSVDENMKQIKMLWATFAAYYQMTLTDIQIQMYAQDCEGHDADVIKQAMQVWRRDPKHDRMPRPGQLLGIIPSETTMSPNELSTRLIAAVRKHGYTWPSFFSPADYKHGSFEEDFKQELGEDAWEVVRMFGGWTRFCETCGNSGGNETALRAQIRDLSDAVLVRRRRENIRMLPSLQPKQISTEVIQEVI